MDTQNELMIRIYYEFFNFLEKLQRIYDFTIVKILIGNLFHYMLHIWIDCRKALLEISQVVSQ